MPTLQQREHRVITKLVENTLISKQSKSEWRDVLRSYLDFLESRGPVEDWTADTLRSVIESSRSMLNT